MRCTRAATPVCAASPWDHVVRVCAASPWDHVVRRLKTMSGMTDESLRQAYECLIGWPAGA